MDSLKVKDYMTRHPVTFDSGMTLSIALEKVIHSEHFGGPVVDESGKVIGFLSEQDLLDKLVKVGYHCQDTHVVGDCMNREVCAVSPELSIIELAHMMKVGRPKVYPVIEEEDNRLVGLITRRSVLKAIEKSLVACFQHQV
ncbi:inosine 5'-monophosphate dehydrogenase [Vibrio aerogenes CECT 7868]|uniref:Inosine 5'-monophosphate dehydrogenase n=1 Tax=Vibrio aerogenes CECT 7868 TaxID=1216006 RepID=A0A1M6B463_9VIBR|nr:CBS domain-containing protein [Vibrio aerogenes]SHI43253.1 inosine 5'-monophosphate dehydrogenase [Vibrio aerogenes CECT 7868]